MWIWQNPLTLFTFLFPQVLKQRNQCRPHCLGTVKEGAYQQCYHTSAASLEDTHWSYRACSMARSFLKPSSGFRVVCRGMVSPWGANSGTSVSGVERLTEAALAPGLSTSLCSSSWLMCTSCSSVGMWLRYINNMSAVAVKAGCCGKQHLSLSGTFIIQQESLSACHLTFWLTRSCLFAKLDVASLRVSM